MDCYDEILKISQENDRINKFVTYLTDLINKNSKNLTELQFINCLILTLAIWNQKFIDLYLSKGKETNFLPKNKKALLITILESEFRDINN